MEKYDNYKNRLSMIELFDELYDLTERFYKEVFSIESDGRGDIMTFVNLKNNTESLMEAVEYVECQIDELR